MDEQVLQELFKALSGAYAESGLGAAGLTLLLFGTRLYRLPLVQKALPAKVRWDNLQKWVRYTLVFALPVAGSVGLAVLGGAGWAAAISAGIAAGVAALGLGAGSRAIGEKLPSTGKPLVDASIRVAFPKELQPKPVVTPDA